jgi:hypothetical protein
MSTTTLDLPPDVAEYLRVVRNALADLPADERDDLLAEVEASLLEAASDTSGTIAAKLGPPEEFAAELRAAAGLHEAATTPQPQISLIAELRTWAATNPRALAVRKIAGELAPIWWAVRGYLAVGLIALLSGASWSTTNHAVPRLGSGGFGVVAVLVAIALSVWLGLRTHGRKTRFAALLLVVNVVLLLAAIPIARKVIDTQNAETRMLVALAYAPRPAAAPTEGLSYYGKPIQNIYPYSRDGKLLHDVLLYDGAGNRLEIRGEDPNRRIVVINGWDKLLNAFPIRYYEPGTRHVAHPNAGPPIRKPGILAPSVTTPTVTTP